MGSLLLLGALVAGGLTMVWMGSRMAAPPEQAPARGTEQDGLRAQQIVFDILRRSSSRRSPGQRTRSEYVLREAEFNAFLGRHLGRVTGLPVTDLAARFVGGGVIEVSGRIDLDEATRDSSLAGYLPESWRNTGVVLTLRGPVRIETDATRGQARALRFDADEAYVGRQRVPVAAVERLLATGDRFGRWSVPESVTAVIIEPGRAVVRVES